VVSGSVHVDDPADEVGERPLEQRKAPLPAPVAVMPWTVSRSTVVTTVTPVANRPITWRKVCAASTTAGASGVSSATPVAGGSLPLAPVDSFFGCDCGGGIKPELSVGRATRVRRATPSGSVTIATIARGRRDQDRGRVLSGS